MSVLKNMRTVEIELQLFKKFDVQKTLNATNITRKSKILDFEADYISLSEAGYATAIEIKITKSDLKADLKKKHIARLTSAPLKSWGKRTALDIYYKRLKYFYYAVPPKLIETALDQIPDFAGLMEVTENGINVIRKPQVLFNFKWNDVLRYKLARLGSIKAYNLKNKIVRLENKIIELKSL
jgi:hypothetical protein